MFPDAMTLSVEHECRICNTRVLQTVQKLSSHVHTHEISLENYHKKFILGIEIEQAGSTASRPSAPSKKVKFSVAFVTWANQCKYECKTCGLTSHTMNALTVHLKNKHNFVISTPKESAALVNPTTVYHKCLLCHKQILQSMGVIQKHMKLVHNMDAKDYYLQKVCNQFSAWSNACGFSCNECDNFKTNSTESLAGHMEFHGWRMAEFEKHYLALMTQKVAHTCLICFASILQESFSLNDHLSGIHGLAPKEYYDNYVASGTPLNSVMTAAATAATATATSGTISGDNWMNGCKFNCKICTLHFDCLMDIKNHMSVFHQTTLEAYVSVHGSAIVKLTNLVCHICKAEVPHDPEFVTNHLRQKHQITPEKYRRLYAPQPGKYFFLD